MDGFYLNVFAFQAKMFADQYEKFKQYDFYGSYHAFTAKPILNVNNPEIIKVSEIGVRDSSDLYIYPSPAINVYYIALLYTLKPATNSCTTYVYINLLDFRRPACAPIFLISIFPM